MGALKLPTISSHVVDILGSTRGRDQPIMLMEKALLLSHHLPASTFQDPNTIFFDPFCKAGEVLLACAIRYCEVNHKNPSDMTEITSAIFHSNRFFALAPDVRHYLLGLRTFYGNEKSHNPLFNKNIKNGNYLSEIDGTLEIEKYHQELNNMINFIKEQNPNAKIVAIGNPPYQENYDGEANNTGANPIYHLFLNALMTNANIHEYVMVIPARWFAGGRGQALKDFAENLKTSRKVVSICDFEDSREVFPTVDIKGGVCFLHWNSQHDGPTTFLNVKTNETSSVDLASASVIIREGLSRSIVEKVAKKTDTYLSDVAWSWNAFNISSNYFEKNAEDEKGELECFTKRMIVKKIKQNKITKNANKIATFKVAYPKAVKTGGVPYSKDQLFILNKTQICSETYMIMDTFSSQKEAKMLLAYLQTDFVRFLISLKKITQDMTKETWSLVPVVDLSKEWTNESLMAHFKLTKEEQAHIQRKVEEWS